MNSANLSLGAFILMGSASAVLVSVGLRTHTVLSVSSIQARSRVKSATAFLTNDTDVAWLPTWAAPFGHRELIGPLSMANLSISMKGRLI